MLEKASTFASTAVAIWLTGCGGLILSPDDGGTHVCPADCQPETKVVDKTCPPWEKQCGCLGATYPAGTFDHCQFLVGLTPPPEVVWCCGN